MSSIQAYKAHKQEGTIAATTLVSKMHKQGGIFEFPSIPTSVAALHVKLGTKVLMPRVDYASLQPCCSLWLFVQLELYSALSLDYAVVVAMSCFCMCYAIQ